MVVHRNTMDDTMVRCARLRWSIGCSGGGT
jgi:hypothetical protein